MVGVKNLIRTHERKGVLKQAPQSGVTAKEIREPNGLTNERLNHVLKATKDAQASKIIDVVSLNPNYAI
jgi:hypothetical protein